MEETHSNGHGDVSKRIVLGFKWYLLAPIVFIVPFLWFPLQLPSSGPPGSPSAIYGGLPYSGLFLTLYFHTGLLLFMLGVFWSVAKAFMKDLDRPLLKYNLLTLVLIIPTIGFPLIGFSVLGFSDPFYFYCIGPYAIYTLVISGGMYFHIKNLEGMTGLQLMLLRGSYTFSNTSSRFFLRSFRTPDEEITRFTQALQHKDIPAILQFGYLSNVQQPSNIDRILAGIPDLSGSGDTSTDHDSNTKNIIVIAGGVWRTKQRVLAGSFIAAIILAFLFYSIFAVVFAANLIIQFGTFVIPVISLYVISEGLSRLTYQRGYRRIAQLLPKS